MVNYLIPAAGWSPVFSNTMIGDGGFIAVDFYTSTSGVQLQSIGWYRGTTGTPAPTNLYIRDTVTNTDLVSLTATDDGLIGWHYVNFTGGPTMVVSRIYRLGATLPAGFTVYQSAIVTPDAPFLYETSHFGHYWPTLEGTNTVEQGISVADAPVTGPATPGDTTTIITTPGTVAGDLASWLSSNATTQTHETDGLPWLTKEQVDLIKATADLIANKTDNIFDIVSLSWKIAEVLTELEIGAWNLFAKRAPSQLTGSSGGGGSAFFSGDGRQVANSAAEAVDWGARQWHRTETSNWLVPVPGTDWELSDSIDFTGPIAWEVPADCYVCTFTAWPVWVDQALVVGRQYLPRAAWWAPVTADLTHERHFCDLSPQVLHALPMRCPGILFNPKDGYQGTLQAYLRPDPGMS